MIDTATSLIHWAKKSWQSHQTQTRPIHVNFNGRIKKSLSISWIFRMFDNPDWLGITPSGREKNSRQRYFVGRVSPFRVTHEQNPDLARGRWYSQVAQYLNAHRRRTIICSLAFLPPLSPGGRGGQSVTWTIGGGLATVKLIYYEGRIPCIR